MLNQDIFTKAPTQNRLVNYGVAEVSEDHFASALTVLRYPLLLKQAEALSEAWMA